MNAIESKRNACEHNNNIAINSNVRNFALSALFCPQFLIGVNFYKNMYVIHMFMKLFNILI